MLHEHTIIAPKISLTDSRNYAPRIPGERWILLKPQARELESASAFLR
jgi:hypothetical protein